MSHYPPPQQGGYPPTQGGYPPTQGTTGYPPQQGTGYPPQQGTGYPPPQHGTSTFIPPGGYPPPQQGTTGYVPPGGYPPTQGGTGYPPQQGTGYPPQQGGYPPQQGGYPPTQGGTGYPPQQQGNWYSNYQGQISNTYMSDLQMKFSQLDKDRSGSITAKELTDLYVNNQPLSQDTVKVLVKAFDKDNSGTISFDEYAALNQYVTKLTDAFYQFDTDRSGKLSSEEAVRALQVEDIRVTVPTLERLLNRIVPPPTTTTTTQVYTPGKRELTTEQFIRLSGILAEVKSAFWTRDPYRSGKVSFGLEEFVDMYAQLSV